MCFKFNQKLTPYLGVLFLALLSSCSLVKDEPKTSSSFNIVNLDCLKVAPTQLSNLFNGNYSYSARDQKEVDAIWNCLDTSLETFSKYVRGGQPGSYTLRELQTFANRYLPENQPLTNEFSDAIFKLKSSVVGGDSSRITQEEIKTLRGKLRDFGVMIKPLSPYIGTLINSSRMSPEARAESNVQLNAFASNLAQFFGRSAAPLAWNDLNQFVVELENYVGKKNHIFGSGVLALQATTPILIGGKGDALRPEDLKQLIQKGIKLYLTWCRDDTQKTIEDQIGSSMDIMLSAPSFYSVTLTEVNTALDKIEEYVNKMLPNTFFDWKKYRKYVLAAFKLKAVLFKNDPNSITSYELDQLAYLYGPFRKSSSLVSSLDALSSRIRNRPLAHATIKDLIPIINDLLPEGKSLESFGLNEKILGDLKVIFLGGNRETISSTQASNFSSEYSRFAQMLSVLYANVYPKIQALPKDFKADFNSQTIEILEGALNAFMQFREDGIPISDIKTLLQDLLQQANYQVKDQTLNQLLIGLSTRVFERSKDEKPKSIDGLVFYPNQLGPITLALKKIRIDLADIENAYRGLDITTQTLSRAQLQKSLTRKTPLLVSAKIQPLINGTDHLIQFPSKEQSRDQYFAYDVAYKTFVYGMLEFAFPLYKSEKNQRAGLYRLSGNDVVDLLTDFNDLIYDLRLSYSNSTPEESAKSRMRSVNLFTQTGNGDEYLDPIETTEFLTITLGGKVLLGNIEKTLFPLCNPGVDPRKIKTISYRCLSKVFFSKDFMSKIYGRSAPILISQYLNYDSNSIDTFRKAALTATRPDWTENGQFPIDDFETLTSLPYYVENIFQRFDSNGNDFLSFSEIMRGFPVFCREIQSAGGKILENDRCDLEDGAEKTKAIYGFLVFNGKPPRGIKPGDRWLQKIKAGWEYVKWIYYWKRLSKDPADRDPFEPQIDRSRLLQIISNLSATTSSPNDGSVEQLLDESE